ncbi:MAG: 2TM domain-containing protein [Aquiluna sp.]
MAENRDAMREFAQKQLKKKQDFRTYMWVYAAVVALTSGVWFITTPSAPYWPIWVVFGMGIAAIFVGLDAYGRLGGKPITDDQIDAEVERLKRKG